MQARKIFKLYCGLRYINNQLLYLCIHIDNSSRMFSQNSITYFLLYLSLKSGTAYGENRLF